MTPWNERLRWAWTRDGRLLLSYSRDGLYVVDDIYSGQPRLIKSFVGKTLLHLDVSPDNSKVAFIFGEKRQLFVMNMDGTGLRQVTVSTEPAIDNTIVEGLSWSPDGQNIALYTAAIVDSLPCSGRAVLIVNADALEAPLPELSSGYVTWSNRSDQPS